VGGQVATKEEKKAVWIPESRGELLEEMAVV
jgi:hypothetical protein